MIPRWFAFLGALLVVGSYAAAQDEPGAARSHPAALVAAVDAWQELRTQQLPTIDADQIDPIHSNFSAIELETREVLAAIDLILVRLVEVATQETINEAVLAGVTGDLEAQMTAIIEQQLRLTELETEWRDKRHGNRPSVEDADPLLSPVAWLARYPETWEAWRALDALARGNAEQRELAAALAERAEAARKARVALVHVTRGEELAVRREEVKAEMIAAIAAIIEADPRAQRNPAADAEEGERSTPTPVPTRLPEIDTSAFRGYVHQAREALKAISTELHKWKEAAS